jgi:hypothetical protein
MFGMLIYETEMGHEPYVDMYDFDAIKRLVIAGGRPHPPPYDMHRQTIWQVYDKCTAQRPGDRPTAAGVIDMLDACLQNTPE